MIKFEDENYCFKLPFREFEVNEGKVDKEWYLYDISLFDKNKQEYIYSTLKKSYKFLTILILQFYSTIAIYFGLENF